MQVQESREADFCLLWLDLKESPTCWRLTGSPKHESVLPLWEWACETWRLFSTGSCISKGVLWHFRRWGQHKSVGYFQYSQNTLCAEQEHAKRKSKGLVTSPFSAQCCREAGEGISLSCPSFPVITLHQRSTSEDSFPLQKEIAAQIRNLLPSLKTAKDWDWWACGKFSCFTAMTFRDAARQTPEALW